MPKKSSKISEATKEELWLAVANIAAAEEHACEICSKSSNSELKKDLRQASDNMRNIRQYIVNSGCFE